MATVEIQPGEAVFKEQEVNEAFEQRDQALNSAATAKRDLEKANRTVQDQKVLINQSAKVVDEINKIFPGLFNGGGIASLDLGKLMDGKVTKVLQPECEKLFKLMEEYKKTNPIIL